MARLLWYLDSSSPQQTRKNVVRVGPPLTKLSDPRMKKMFKKIRERRLVEYTVEGSLNNLHYFETSD